MWCPSPLLSLLHSLTSKEAAEADRHAEALLAEEEAEKERRERAKASKAKRRNKTKMGGCGGSGAAGPSQEPERAVAVEEAAKEVEVLAALEEAQLAAALEERRLEEGRRPAAGEQGSTSSAAGAPTPREEEPPDDFICPITQEMMSDPAMAADGHSYERQQIERWLTTKSTSPLTGGELDHPFLAPNHMLRRQIREWREAQ